jgi:hypothetical protein
MVSPKTKTPKYLIVHDRKAAKYFRTLESFLGTKAIEDCFRNIELEIGTVKGTYLEYWVIPNRSWWLGFKHARDVLLKGKDLRGKLTPEMYRPLQTATQLSCLQASMPAAAKKEFRSRILSAHNLNPVLFELDVASHFLRLGYEIHWSSPKLGKRIPEFRATKRGSQIEVECKTKQADAGRRVLRPHFYLLFDALVDSIGSKDIMGDVFITTPTRMPVSTQWRDETVKAISTNLRPGQQNLPLPDGTTVSLKLQLADNQKLTKAEIKAKMLSLRSPFTHIGVHALTNSQGLQNPIFFRVESQKPDRFLDDVLGDLRDANRQFSGQYTSVICCFIPEIDSFNGLENKSAIRNMTAYFFDKHAQSCVCSVTYASDYNWQQQSQGIESALPALTFESAKYDNLFGPSVSISGIQR